MRGELLDDPKTKHKYWRQFYGNGTLCDLTGKPRGSTAKVRPPIGRHGPGLGCWQAPSPLAVPRVRLLRLLRVRLAAVGGSALPGRPVPPSHCLGCSSLPHRLLHRVNPLTRRRRPLTHLPTDPTPPPTDPLTH
eukprot:scaffold33767_cov36-Phaeocystis_antarctica.AAC.1